MEEGKSGDPGRGEFTFRVRSSILGSGKQSSRQSDLRLALPSTCYTVPYPGPHALPLTSSCLSSKVPSLERPFQTTLNNPLHPRPFSLHPQPGFISLYCTFSFTVSLLCHAPACELSEDGASFTAWPLLPAWHTVGTQ